jgi:hypothetical protein
VEKLVGGRDTPKQATRATDRRARKVMVDLLCQALTAPMLLRKIYMYKVVATEFFGRPPQGGQTSLGNHSREIRAFLMFR